ncbi:MAG: ferredoxin reductase family protein [Acidimicrobiales bacterium]
MTTTFDPATGAGRKATQRQAVVPVPPPPRPALGRAAVRAAVVGLVVMLAVGASTESGAELHVPGGVATFLGGMAGLAGMYLALVMVVVVSRIPQLERILGQDGLVRWHRRLGPWPISLLVAHALLVTIGYAEAAKTGALHELGVLIRSYPDMLAATVGLGLVVMAGVASIRAVRSRMRRETWWVMHLYLYLALALSFPHVLALGPTFVGHPLVQAMWCVVWATTAGTVLVYRVGLPVVRSLRHRLRVVEVRHEAPGVVSIICSGRHLSRLAVAGGQFFQWRFLRRGLWWQAHPYSISAVPRPPYLRLTVRQIGDHSAAVGRVRPGTRVAIEGPYGAVTARARRHQRVLLVAGGIGVTALRSLLDDLPQSSEPVVVLRAATEDGLVLRDEMAELVRQRKGRLHAVVGSRSEAGSARRILARLVPDLARRDVYVCGRPGFVEEVVAAAQQLGAHRDAVHYEIYSW